MVDAAIKDVMVKIGRGADLLKSNAIGTSANLVARPKRRWTGWRKPGAAAVVMGKGVAMGVTARSGEGAGGDGGRREDESTSAPRDAV